MSEEDYKKFWLGMLIFALVVIIIFCSMWASWQAKDKHDHSPYKSYETYHKKEYKCPKCGGTDTSGFSTFWDADGSLTGGNLDYKKEHCSYTIMGCETCGEYFKLYKEQW